MRQTTISQHRITESRWGRANRNSKKDQRVDRTVVDEEITTFGKEISRTSNRQKFM